MKAIPIYKGDHSGAFGLRPVKIILKTGLDLASFSATAEFRLLSITRSFTQAETATKEFVIEFAEDETVNLPLGIIFGSFTLYDNTDLEHPKTLNSASRIPFEVLIPGKPCQPIEYGKVCIDADYSVIEISISLDYEIITNKPTLNGETIEGDKTSADYHLMGEGADYDDLVNKPQIEGVELSGNVSADTLRLARVSALTEVAEQLDSAKITKITDEQFDALPPVIKSIDAISKRLEAILNLLRANPNNG